MTIMEKRKQSYKEFTIDAFLLDEAFIDWIKTPTEEKDLFWKQFLEEYPEKKEELEAAKAMAVQLKFVPDQPAADSADRVWNSILAGKKQERSKVVSFSKNIWWAAAAVFILIAGNIWFLSQPKMEEIETRIGEIKNIVLPDGSRVALKANSTLKFKHEWNSQMVREVWIEGAGFFDVVHKNKAGTPVQPADRFVVHMKNMNVEVLGTTFSVTTRQTLERVVLQTGSVKVTRKGERTFVYLEPGEMAQYSTQKKTISKEKVNTAEVSLQKDNRFKFNNTPLTEVVQLIEDTYGYKVVIADSLLLQRKLSGTLSSEYESVLFKALETMLDVKMTLSGQTVTINHR